MKPEIVVVSGLPRSGTSLMMQMLQNGGMEVLTDGERTADPDNPRGYLELELVKKIKEDTSWLAEARGKAVKLISQLLFDLPPSEEYRVLFMERDLDEVLASQEKMLARLGRPAAPREAMKRGFQLHLTKVRDWLEKQANLKVKYVDYVDAIRDPERQAASIAEFLGPELEIAAMAAAVDPLLYRNRKDPSSS